MPPRGFNMVLMILVALAVFGLGNFYVLRRGWQALAGLHAARAILLAAGLGGIFCFVAGRFLVMKQHSLATGLMAVVGYWYLLLFLYGLLLILAVDLVRLFDAFFHFLPAALRHTRLGARLGFALVAGTAAALMIAGSINALRLRTVRQDILIRKSAGPVRALRAVLVSDIHLSPVIRLRHLEAIIRRVNDLSPDIVFLAGDLVNEDANPDDLQGMARALRTIRAPLGVFACTGNHEYFAGMPKAAEAVRRGGARVLEDECVLVGDAFIVAGRKDRSSGYRGGPGRLSVAELLAGRDPARPVILLDHQPVRLDEAREAGVDLQLSGHTHNGQIIPINWINKGIYELNWGYLRKGATQYYVTSGAGTWGPPVRLGSVSEIVLLNITFAPSAPEPAPAPAGERRES